jgi:hypothetical protein
MRPQSVFRAYANADDNAGGIAVQPRRSSTSCGSALWTVLLVFVSAVAVTSLVVGVIALLKPVPNVTVLGTWVTPGYGDPAPELGLPGQFYLDLATGSQWYKIPDSTDGPVNAGAAGYGGAVDETRNTKRAAKVYASWIKVTQVTSLSGDVSGTSDNVTVTKVGGLSAAFIAQAVLATQNMSDVNGTGPTLSTNGISLPATSTPDARLTWIGPSTLQFDNAQNGSVTVNVKGDLLVNGVEVGNVLSALTVTTPQTVPVFADSSGRRLAQSSVTIDSNANMNNINTLTAQNINVNGVPVGTVNGPALSGINEIAVYDGTSGRLIKSITGVTISPGKVLSGLTDVYVNGVARGDVFSTAAVSPNTISSVPVFTDSNGKQLSATLVQVSPNGTVSGVSNLYATSIFINGTSLNALIQAGSVAGPVLPVTDSSIALFDGSTGRLLKSNTGVVINALNQLTGLSSLNINGLNVNMSGPASATPMSLPFFASSDGRVLSSSNVLYYSNGTLSVPTALWVQGRPRGDVFFVASSNITSVPRSLAVFSDSTGLNIQPSPVYVWSNGTVTGIRTLNADTIFLNGTSLSVLLQNVSTSPTSDISTPVSTNDNYVVLWSGTTGKALKSASSIAISSLNDITGVNSITVASSITVNGLQLNVSGPASSVPNAIAVYRDATGKILASSSAILASNGSLILNGEVYVAGKRRGDVFGPVSSVTGSIAVFNDASGTLLASSSIAISANGTMTGIKAFHAEQIFLNGSNLAMFLQNGSVVGPSSSSDNFLVLWDGNTGRLLKQSTSVSLSPTNALTGLSSVTVNGLQVNMSGPASSTPTALAIFADSSGRVLSVGSALLAANGSLLLSNDVLVQGQKRGNVFGVSSSAVVDGALAVFNGTSGVQLGVSPIMSSSNGTLSGVRVLNVEKIFLNGSNLAMFLQNGSVSGPPSSSVTDSTVVLWDGSTGRLLKQSASVVISPSNDITGVNSLTINGLRVNVSGPASAQPNSVAFFTSSDGRVIASSSNFYVYSNGTVVITGGGDFIAQNRRRGDVFGVTLSVAGTVPVWNDTTGTLLQSSPVSISSNGTVAGVTALRAEQIFLNGSNLALFLQNGSVAGPSSSSDNFLVLWDGNTGRLLKQSSGVALSPANALTGLSSITVNGLQVNVSGPASSTPTSLAIFADSSGRVLSSGGTGALLAANGSLLLSNDVLVQGQKRGNVFGVSSNAVVDGAFAVFNGTSGVQLGVSPVTSSTNGTLMGIKHLYAERIFLNGTNLSMFLQNGSVAGPATTVTDSNIVLWDGSSGRLLKQATSVSISASNDITGVNSLTINGLRVNVSGPASSQPNAVAFFASSDGRVLQSAARLFVFDNGSVVLVGGGDFMAQNRRRGDVFGVAASVAGTVPVWNDTSGTTLQASPVLITSNGSVSGVTALRAEQIFLNGSNLAMFLQNGSVAGPAGSTDNFVVLWDGNTGRLLKQGTVSISPTGVVSGVASLTVSGTVISNGVTLNITGPASSTINGLAIFGDTSGTRLTSPAGVTLPSPGVLSVTSAVNVNGVARGDVFGVSSSTVDQQIALWSGTTGKALQTCPVLINTVNGSISNVSLLATTRLTLNGTDINQVIMNAITSGLMGTGNVTGPAAGSTAAGSIAVWTDSGAVKLGAASGVSIPSSGVLSVATSVSVNGVLRGDVFGAASSVHQQVALFSGTTGKVLQTCPVLINTVDGSISNVSSLATTRLFLNGTDINTVITNTITGLAGTGNVTGPLAGSTSAGSLALWSDTGAVRLYASSGVSVPSLGVLSVNSALQVNGVARGDVFGPSSTATVDTQIALFAGNTGKQLQSCPVLINPNNGSVSNVSSLATARLILNGTDINQVIVNAITGLAGTGNVTGPAPGLTSTGSLAVWSDTSSVRLTTVSGVTVPATGVLSVTSAVNVNGVSRGDVFGPTSATDRQVALFSGATGKLLQFSPVLINPINGSITNVSSIATTRLSLNGTDINQVIVNAIAGLAGTGNVTGPAAGSVSSRSLALWADTSGVRIVGASGVTVPSTGEVHATQAFLVGGVARGDVFGPSTSTINQQVALFSGTSGKQLQTSPVLINPSTGAISNVSSLAAVSISVNGSDILQIIATSVAGLGTGNVKGPTAGAAQTNGLAVFSSIAGDQLASPSGVTVPSSGVLSVTNSLLVNGVARGDVFSVSTESVDQQVAIYSSTSGKVLRTSPVLINPSTGAITNVSSLSTISLTVNGTLIQTLITQSLSLAGNITGPAQGSTTTNALPRFADSTGGRLKDSPVLISDAGAVTGVASVTLTTGQQLNVSGPAASTANSMCFFSDTTGRQLRSASTVTYNTNTNALENSGGFTVGGVARGDVYKVNGGQNSVAAFDSGRGIYGSSITVDPVDFRTSFGSSITINGAYAAAFGYPAIKIDTLSGAANPTSKMDMGNDYSDIANSGHDLKLLLHTANGNSARRFGLTPSANTLEYWAPPGAGHSFYFGNNTDSAITPVAPSFTVNGTGAFGSTRVHGATVTAQVSATSPMFRSESDFVMQSSTSQSWSRGTGWHRFTVANSALTSTATLEASDTFSGFATIAFNGYSDNLQRRFNSAKRRWRWAAYQNGAFDYFFGDSWDGTNGRTFFNVDPTVSELPQLPLGVMTPTVTSPASTNLVLTSTTSQTFSSGTGWHRFTSRNSDLSSTVSLEASTTLPGYASVSFNGYNDGLERRYNTAKRRYRMFSFQGGSDDRWTWDSFDGSTSRTIMELNPSGAYGERPYFAQGLVAAQLDTRGSLTATVPSGWSGSVAMRWYLQGKQVTLSFFGSGWTCGTGAGCGEFVTTGTIPLTVRPSRDLVCPMILNNGAAHSNVRAFINASGSVVFVGGPWALNNVLGFVSEAYCSWYLD